MSNKNNIKMNCRSLRIAFIVGTLGLGGAEKQLYYMIKSLNEKKVRLIIYSLTKNETYENKLEYLGLKVIFIGGSKIFIIRLLTLLICLNKFKPHLIQSSHTYTNIYAGISGFLLRVPSIGAVRSDLCLIKETYKIFYKILLLVNDFLFVNSDKAKSELETLFNHKNNNYKLCNVIDIDEFDQDMKKKVKSDYFLSKKNSDIIVISIGSLLKVKRFDRFIEAFSIAKKQNANLKGILVGDGPQYHELYKLAEDLDLLPNDFYFLRKREIPPPLLKMSDIFVLTSDNEGVPNVILEAMCAKLPVIVTAVGDAPNIISNAKNGYVTSFDSQEISTNILQLSQSKQTRLKFGESGRKYVVSEFNYNKLKIKLLGIYSQILKKNDDFD